MIDTKREDKKEKIINRQSSHNSSFDNNAKINSKIIQKQLIEMGYNIDLINKVLNYFEVTSIERALDYLSKNNQKWNHPFVNVEINNVNNADKCIICNDFIHDHIIINNNIFAPHFESEGQRKDSLILKKTISIDVNTYNEISIKKNKMCDICLSTIILSYELECKHIFCKDCLVDYLSNKITNADVERIKCPTGNCVILIKEEILQILVTPKDYDKYLKFLKRANNSKIPNSCICPIPDCDSYGIINGSSKDIKNFFISCQKGHIFCYNCNQISHPGIDCDTLLENEFIKWKENKIVKKCPMCGFYIEKNFGCNHMTCANKSCNFEFCWICMQVFTLNHYSIPATPCFGLQYTHESSVLVRSRLLRYIRIVFVVIGIILGSILCMVFSTLIYSFSLMIQHSSNLGNSIFQGRNNILKKLFMCCLFLTNFFWGLIYTPLGWIFMSIGILCSPVICPIYCYLMTASFRAFRPPINDQIPLEMEHVIAEPNQINNV